jgi:uncharacterized repeat protein (TIGR01451 family)
MKTPDTTTTSAKVTRLSAVALAAMVAFQPTLAYAAITNDAKATGTYGATTVDSPIDSESVPVAPAAPSLTVVKSLTTAPTIANGANTGQTDALDTIVYGYVITNNGNVTMNGVVPVDAGPQFNGTAGVNSLASFTGVTLAPGASAAFSATYTLAALDVLRAADIAAGVTNVATASGTPVGSSTLYTSPDSNQVDTTITGFSELTIVKSAALADVAGGTALAADVGETITYTYTISNTGTRSLTNVQVNDDHEVGTIIPVGGATGINSETLTVAGPLGAGASTNGTVGDGIYATLAPGATVTMTYLHGVTQTEFNNQ